MSEKIDMHQLPGHIAVIMDGNGRWAKKRLLSRSAGHKAGASALRRLSEAMNRDGFKILTIYAFSTENWKRSEEEVSNLMNLLREYIQNYINDSNKNDMRISTIGDLTRLDRDLQEQISYLMELTKNNKGMRVNIAINYGGRDEILRGIKSLIRDVANGREIPAKLDEESFKKYLDTWDLPDPDLIIRTSGEYRLSNFLIWQGAYAEFYVSDKLWPDFTISDLYNAVKAFQSRERRFGGR